MKFDFWWRTRGFLLNAFGREDAFGCGAEYENGSTLHGLGGLVLGSSYFVEEFFGPQKQKQRLCSALLAGIFGCSPLMVHQAQFRVFGGGFWGGLKLSSAS